LTLPNVIRLMLPVAAFVAVVYTTNRMAGESELVVMQATGFSPFRLARPVLYFGIDRRAPCFGSRASSGAAGAHPPERCATTRFRKTSPRNS
jgi:hypothetical protein